MISVDVARRCITAGLGLHLLVIGRIVATHFNENAAIAAGAPARPGATFTAVAFYGVVLLSSALVWRYLLWPLSRTRR